jgi:hypothetical protein
VFGLAILVPAGALLLVGWRTLALDRTNAELEARVRLDATAGLAAAALDQDFARWQALLEAVPRPCPATTDVLSAALRAALDEPGAGVLVCVDGPAARRSNEIAE